MLILKNKPKIKKDEPEPEHRLDQDKVEMILSEDQSRNNLTGKLDSKKSKNELLVEVVKKLGGDEDKDTIVGTIMDSLKISKDDAENKFGLLVNAGALIIGEEGTVSKSDIIGSKKVETQDVIKCKYYRCIMNFKSDREYRAHLVSYHGEDVDTS